MRHPGPCPTGRHHFDATSGWCWNARCGWRNDGQSEYAYDPNYLPGARLTRNAPDITEPRRKATP